MCKRKKRDTLKNLLQLWCVWEIGNQYPEYWRLLEDQKRKDEIWRVFIKHTESVIVLLSWSDSLWPPRTVASSVHGIPQAKILEWGAISFQGVLLTRDWIQVSCITYGFFKGCWVFKGERALDPKRDKPT